MVSPTDQRCRRQALLAPCLVQEQIRGDAVQPAVEGAWLEVGQGLEHANKDLLGEIFGVVLVAGQAVGEAKDLG